MDGLFPKAAIGKAIRSGRAEAKVKARAARLVRSVSLRRSNFFNTLNFAFGNLMLRNVLFFAGV